MLTCVARRKQRQANNKNNKSASHHFQRDDSDSVSHNPNPYPNTKQPPTKFLTSQKIKGIAIKASGAYKCNPNAHRRQTGGGAPVQSPTEPVPSGSEKFKPAWHQYRRTESANSSASSATATPQWGKEMEARLKGLSIGKGVREEVVSPTSTSVTLSDRRVDSVVLVEESEGSEWVAEVEPGVLITFVSLARGGNHLKRIRFNRDVFNQWQAQKWWSDSYEKIIELHNVQRLSRHAFPLPTPPRSDDENSKMGSTGDSPITPPLSKESIPLNLYPAGTRTGYSSSDSFEQHSKQYESSDTVASTPKHSNMSGVTSKTETSSIMDESLMSTTPSRDTDQQSKEMLESEWVEEVEPGVYITLRVLPGGRRELRRVRFSREIFGETHARVWWEENRDRIHEQYL